MKPLGIFRLFSQITVVCLCLAATSGWAQPKVRSEEFWQFIDQIRERHDAEALATLEANTNLAVAVEMGHVPLAEAAAAGNRVLVKRMLELGADVNKEGDIFNSSGAQRTPLHWAVERSHPDICGMLLAAGADPNHMTPFETPLVLAFKKNDEQSASLLLDYGADPFLFPRTYNPSTPFELDITESNGKLVAQMLGQDAQHPLGAKSVQPSRPSRRPRPGSTSGSELLSRRGGAFLKMAAERGELEAVQTFFRMNLSIKDDTNCPTIMQSFSLGALNASRTLPGTMRELQQAQEQLKADYIANANPEFVASLHSQEAKLTNRLEMLAAERWVKLRDILVQHGAVYDAFAATAFNDTNQASRLLNDDKNTGQSRDCNDETLLHWAIKTDQPTMAQFWISSGAPLDATNSNGQTALHLAAAAGKSHLVKVLLTAKASPAIHDTNGKTALDLAIQGKQADCIHLLLPTESSAHPERSLAISLHQAAATGNVAALSAMLEADTNLEARNELGLTPLQVAVTKGHLAAAALLIDKGANLKVTDPDGNTLLHQIFMTDYSVHDRPPINWMAHLKDSPFKAACLTNLNVSQYEQGPNPIMQGTYFLLACGLDAKAKNHKGETVTQWIMEDKTARGIFFFDGEREQLLKVLGSAGGKVDERDREGNTALHRLAQAVDANDVERLAAIIAAGADVNATNNAGQTPLHVAATRIWGWDGNEPGTNEPFQLLVYSKADVNARDGQGHTPLQILAAADTSFKKEAFQLLIASGADPNAQDEAGYAALHLVAQSDDPFCEKTVRLLLESGADPNLKDKHGRTPAHLFLQGKWPWNAARGGLALLANPKTDLSIKDDQGKTPLHYLAAMGNEHPLFLLRGIGDIFAKAKVDVDARDKDGSTPALIAAKTGTSDVFDWLVKQGANLDATNNAGKTPRLLKAPSKR